MIQKQEIVEWFKQQRGHERLDLLCSLLNHCVPFESHYLKSFILMFAKRDSFPTHEYDVVSSFLRNNFTWDPETVGISDKTVRRRLVFFLSLLEGDRRQEARSIFKLLVNPSTLAYLENFRQKRTRPLHCTSEEGENICSELLLIYTMALHHPVFTYDERTQFGACHKTLVESISSPEQHGTNPINSQDSSQPSHCPVRVGTSGSPPSLAKTSGEQKPAGNVPLEVNQPARIPLHSARRHNSGRSNRRYSGTRVEVNNCKPHENAVEPLVKGHESGNSSDVLVNELQERLRKDCSLSSSSLQKLLDKHSVSDLACMTDTQLQKLGLNSSLVTQFRQMLNGKSLNKHHGANGVSEVPSTRSPGVGYSCEDQYFQQYPPLTPEASTSPKSIPVSATPIAAGNSSATVGQLPDNAAPPNPQEQPSDAQSVNHNLGAGGVSHFSYPSVPATGYPAYPVSVPQQQQPPPQQQARATSQPRELPRLARVPIALSFSAPAQPNAYYITANASGSNMETPVTLVPAQQIISLGQISPVSELQQPAFAIPAPAGHPGAAAQAVAYPVAGGILVQGQLGPQTVAAVSSRPGSGLEMPATVSPCTLFFSPLDLDFTRPPPQIRPARVSCYNCGLEGHRGDECPERGTEESNPS